MSPDKITQPMSMEAIRGLGFLAEDYRRERAQLFGFIARTRELFDQYPEGLQEGDLIELLTDEGATRSEASVGTDELISNGHATKNWKNGWLSHVDAGEFQS